jgi:uncharacterized cupredoxin-like copper-binding protein
MATSTESTQDGAPHTPIEDELHELQREERELEARADRLSLAGGLTLVFSILALIIGVTALTIALIANGKSTKSSTPSAASPSPTAPASPTAPRAPAIASGKVDVKLGEMFVRPGAQVIKAGKVTFSVANTGKLTHEMIVSRLPVKVKPNGQANEANSVGEVPELQPGSSGKVTLKLAPGTYQLFCNVPGHYAAGQHTSITVKG